ncbi:hypothetical protein GIW70_19610 [Pseudomonas syringae]|nr:hypothetical protein [Pseudomonas syringae]MCF5070400.1 hypothetical protein [Pseudomonas syringae]
MERVCQVLLERRSLEGLDELRAGLLINLDSEVLDQVERGDWLLLRMQAEFGHWPVAASVFDQTVLDLMNKPPAQQPRTPRIFRLVDSMTGEPLAQQAYVATIDGVASQHQTDAAGIAHLFASEDVRQISLKIFSV